MLSYLGNIFSIGTAVTINTVPSSSLELEGYKPFSQRPGTLKRICFIIISMAFSQWKTDRGVCSQLSFFFFFFSLQQLVRASLKCLMFQINALCFHEISQFSPRNFLIMSQNLLIFHDISLLYHGMGICDFTMKSFIFFPASIKSNLSMKSFMKWNIYFCILQTKTSISSELSHFIMKFHLFQGHLKFYNEISHILNEV